MSSPSFDFEQWQADYWAASPRRARDLVLELIEQPLPPEIVEEIDLGMMLTEVRDEVVSTNDFPAILQFFAAVRDRQPDLYAAEYPYFDTFLVEYYLYLGDREQVSRALHNFRTNPVHGIDQLWEVLDYLSFYGASDLARELCYLAYEPVRQAPDIIRGAEEELSRIHLYACLERSGADERSGRPVDWNALQAELQPFGLTAKVLADLRRDLTADLPLPEELSAAFADDLAKSLRRLSVASCRQLATCKGIGFLASKAIWEALIEFLERRDLPPSQLRSPDAFFAFSEEDLDSHLHQLVSAPLASGRRALAVALLWGIPYLYDLLHAVGAIALETHATAIAATETLKVTLCQLLEPFLWRYDFVHRWQPPDSVSPAAFQAEAERFRASFERAEPLSDEPALKASSFSSPQGAAEELANSPALADLTPAAPLSPDFVPAPPPPTAYKLPKQKQSPLKLAAELGRKWRRR